MLQSASPELKTCDVADVLTERRHMDVGIRSLWQPAPPVSGPAYTVHCPAGTNLMLHAAIYRAPEGSVIVVQGGDALWALAGGNVCLTAQRRGIRGFILDGVVRDIDEIRDIQFPVYARGVVPKPAKKESVTELGQTITCGGISVAEGDFVMADENGILVVAKDEAETTLAQARSKLQQASSRTYEAWRASHQAKIERILNESA